MFVASDERVVSGAVGIEIPGGVSLGQPGLPDLPVLTYLVAVPDRGDIALEVLSSHERILEDYVVSPAVNDFEIGKEPVIVAPDASVYSADALYPAEVASISDPVIMRDLRLVQVRVHPVRFNPVSRTLVVTDRVEFRIQSVGGIGVNEKTTSRSYRSAAFEPLYEDFVLNYDQLPRSEVKRGSYLIITVDGYAPFLSQLVLWKERRGVETFLVNTSQIAPNPDEEDIRDYIAAAYATWDNPPDYVMLVGDPFYGLGFMPTWHYTGETSVIGTDNLHATVDGGDYIPDVLLGRMSVTSPTEVIAAVAKILDYERDCSAASDDWYTNALMVAGNYANNPDIHITSPRQTVLRVGEMLKRAGYAEPDTIFYPPVSGPTEISASIDAGVSFVNYRGWGNSTGWSHPDFRVADIEALSNGYALPILTSIVCGTGDFQSFATDPCFTEAWIRSGSPGDLIGGPVALGPTDYDTHTKWNNAMDMGLFEGLLFEDCLHFGQALLRGKLEVGTSFPLDAAPGGEVEFYYHAYNTIGDPELFMRTGAQSSFDVSHESSIPVGQNAITVAVADSEGDVVPGAEVIICKDGESMESRVLEGGQTISVPLYAATPGQVHVTVYAKNYKPYVGTINVVQEASFVGWYSHAIDDDGAGSSSGNGDGVPNPGETIELALTLRNAGTLVANGVECRLDHPESGQLMTFGTIAPGVTDVGDAPYVIEIPEGTPDGTEVVHVLYVTDSGNDDWATELRYVVGSPLLSYYSVTVSGDGILDPGETATVTVALRNDGEIDATSIAGTLVGPTSGLTVTDGAGSWGTVPAAGMADNSGNTFAVTVASDVAIGHEFTMVVDLEGDGGLAQFVLFPLVVGTPTTADPLGPDAHGYFCYDDTDTAYDEAPTYSWIEIDPTYGGSGTELVLGYEDITDVSLPFTFTYFGQDYDIVGVCTNGIVGMGSQPYWESQPRNVQIPSPLGPDAMIAAFWDELVQEHSDTGPGVPDGTGKVLYEDMGDGRFVVEWSRVATGYDDALQTLELVLFDSDVYPTETGDGEILFQYHTISNSDSISSSLTHNYATVGIENQTQSEGIEYTYYGLYPDEAAVLEAGRAIKFTTDPPDLYPSSDVADGELPARVVLERNYGMPTEGRAELRVYDVNGRVVATLVDGDVDAGNHRVVWNGTTDAGERAASGVYFYRLTALGETHARKMILLK